jgi:hypothetical protein
MPFMSDAILWLFVIFSGVAVGAGFYEMRINVPRWFPKRDGVVTVDAGAMNGDDPGRRFWAFVTTGPLTLLTVASLALAWNPASVRDWWWQVAAVVTMVERVGTFGYFIPTAIRLLRSDKRLSGQTSVTAARWGQLNVLRAMLAMAGWLCALRALSLTE